MYQGLNRLTPHNIKDPVRFLSNQPSPYMANAARFFGPAEHAKYSLFEADGRVSAHVAQARRGAGEHDGNNLIIRFEPGEAGRPVLKGIVFPSKRETAAGQARYQPHHTAYGGGPFAFAGEISANAEGQITYLNNRSGHNRPPPVLGAAMALYLQAQGVLAEDFALALGTYSHQVEHRGAQAFAKAREVIAARWKEINPEARAKLAKQVSALEEQLKAMGPATGPTHGTERSELSRQRARAYSQLKRAENEGHFLQLIGYDPVAQTINPGAAPPRGSYRTAAPAGPDQPIVGKRKQPEPASIA